MFCINEKNTKNARYSDNTGFTTWKKKPEENKGETTCSSCSRLQKKNDEMLDWFSQHRISSEFIMKTRLINWLASTISFLSCRTYFGLLCIMLSPFLIKNKTKWLASSFIFSFIKCFISELKTFNKDRIIVSRLDILLLYSS